MISTPVGRLALAAPACLLTLLCGSCPAHAQQRYAFTDLGPLRNEVPGGGTDGNPGTGFYTLGFAVSAAGHVTGNGDTYVSGTPYGLSGTQDVQHAFLYTGTGIKQDLAPLPVSPGSRYYSPAQCYGYGINGLDAVAGASQVAVSTGQIESHATLWRSGAPVDLGALYNALYPGNSPTNQQNTNSYALGVNDAGQVVGQAFDYAPNPDYHAFLYNASSGALTDIASDLYANEPYNYEGAASNPYKAYESTAYSINSGGQIAGYVYYSSESGDPNAVTYNNGNPINGRYPVLYDPNHPGNTQVLLRYGMTNELISEGGGPPVNGFAHLNNNGSIAYNTADEPNDIDAILWTGGNNYTDLGRLTDTAGNSYSTYVSSANGLNDANQVVGTVEYPYDTATNEFSPTGNASYNAALWQNGHVYALASLVDVPQGVRLLDATGINDAGQIVGTASVGGALHAFLLTPGGAYHVVDLGPVTVNSLDNQGTTVYAINNYGQIVGSNGLWTPDTANDTVSPNGFVGLGLFSYNAINDLGAVAGQGTAGQAVVETPRTPNATGYPNGAGFTTSLLPLLGMAPTIPPSTTEGLSAALLGIAAGSSAYGINDAGQVTGWSTTNRNETISTSYQQVIPGPNMGSTSYANVLAGFLDTPGSAPISIASQGSQLPVLGVGDGYNIYADDGIPGGGVIANNGVLAPPMVITPGGTGINRSGQIAGWGDQQFRDSYDGEDSQPVPDTNIIKAYFYDPGTGSTAAIPALDSAGTGYYSPSPNPFALAYGLNDAAQVVGQSEASGGYGYVQHAFLWQPDGSLFDLGALAGTQTTGSHTYPATGGQLTSVAYHINNLGQAVGWSDTVVGGQSNTGMISSSGAHAVLWSGDAITDLNGEIVAPGWTLQQADGINDKGQIIGEGTLNGVPHAYLLQPAGLVAVPRNVTAQINVAVTGHTFLRGTHTYALRLSNTGGALPGPLYLVLDNLPAGATLLNAAGSTSATVPSGSPYAILPGGLMPSGSVTGILRLNAPLTASTRLRILAGPGAP